MTKDDDFWIIDDKYEDWLNEEEPEYEEMRKKTSEKRKYKKRVKNNALQKKNG